MTSAVRVRLPNGLRLLAGCGAEVRVTCEGAVTCDAVIEGLELLYPVLVGTIRDRATKSRRPFIRFFACKEDYSHAATDRILPDAIINGDEVFLIVGAIAGG